MNRQAVARELTAVARLLMGKTYSLPIPSDVKGLVNLVRRMEDGTFSQDKIIVKELMRFHFSDDKLLDQIDKIEDSSDGWEEFLKKCAKAIRRRVKSFAESGRGNAEEQWALKELNKRLG